NASVRKENANVTSQFPSEGCALSILDDAAEVGSLVVATQFKPNKTIVSSRLVMACGDNGACGPAGGCHAARVEGKVYDLACESKNAGNKFSLPGSLSKQAKSNIGSWRSLGYASDDRVTTVRA